MDGLQPSPPTRTVEDGPDLDVSPLSTFTYRCWTFQLGKWHDRKRSFSSDLEGRDMDAQWMRIYIEKTWKDHPKNQMHGKVRPRKGMHFYIISKFHLLFSYVNQKTQHFVGRNKFAEISIQNMWNRSIPLVTLPFPCKTRQVLQSGTSSSKLIYLQPSHLRA